mmetsp:Transcript_35963/g.49925  ORF Transcript_35963/g.49925 Transcript_35963/m.49925 type:complete len:237 (+) Transcript_35963:146-856(+)|eukprot:CAMPEP_0196585004 /NCGR_PEP_ID=MMETSP1081-20130531/49306_1 /TAXON_ID=36882 /ORGANISM="Pyramimonas amylifera, Strain CCMP720" /LENGTH=236 /DNA_ID=CAMNT_0041906409 /DNA_START=146 /DNA_END=856 /DNA_ORIENTATION=+
MNNNQQTEKSILGVFSTSSYITFGSREKPLNYVLPTTKNHWYNPGVKGVERSNFKGKNLITNPMKQGNMPDTLFEQKFQWISETDTYKDQIRYADKQKDKKSGFLTSNFRRKDEFTSNLNSERYRETLLKDLRCDRKDVDRRMQKGFLPQIKSAQPRAAKSASFLYDLLDKEDSGYPSHVPRDTKNPTHVSLDRDYGTWKTASQSIGGRVTLKDHINPEYGHKPIVKKTFYNNSRL